MTRNRLKKHGMLLGGLAAGQLTLGAALTPAAADERKGINLGTTSFFDGFGGAAPGCTYIQYMGHDGFNTATNGSGNKVANVNLDVNYFVPQLACSSDIKVLGGFLGWNTIVPFSEQDSSSFPANGSGLGDLLVGPYIAWAPIVKDGRPVFANSVEFDIIAPTGKFSSTAVANPGNDYWSISPFWRATYLPAPGWEVSWRTNYLHTFDHQTPTPFNPDGVPVVVNGDAVWINFTLSKEIAKNLHFGLNGYWLKQLSGDTGLGGTKIANSQVESLYIGPGVHYEIDRHNMVNFNVYLPVYDANTLSGGYQVNLQYIHPLN